MTARCDDGVMNGSESDVDCGQGCQPCGTGRACGSNEDCATDKCDQTCRATLELKLLSNERGDVAPCIQPYLHFVNTGAVALSLSAYSVRYYYTTADAGSEIYSCYFLQSGNCNQLAPTHFGDVSPSRPGASRYLELAFTAGAAAVAPGQLLKLESGFCLPGGANFSQADDYSYSSSASFQSTSKVTLYRQGVLVWGSEP